MHNRHDDHTHDVVAHADTRYLAGALALLVLFMLTEIVVALWSGSLALLSDAGHMLSDAGALGIALWVAWLAKRPAVGRRTWGWRRAEILSAAVNGITLLVVAVVIVAEAVQRLFSPPAVVAVPMLIVAAAGIVVNIAVAWLIARANRSSLNVEGAYQHILTDLYGFIGTLVAGVVILMTGWNRADAIASLLVCALMLRAAWGLLREAGKVLLEMAPAGVEPGEVRAHLMGLEHVRDVHDLHVWSVSSDLPALSAHVVLEPTCFQDGHAHQLLDQFQECLRGHFDLAHSTFQLEPPLHSACEETCSTQ